MFGNFPWPLADREAIITSNVIADYTNKAVMVSVRTTDVGEKYFTYTTQETNPKYPRTVFKHSLHYF